MDEFGALMDGWTEVLMEGGRKLVQWVVKGMQKRVQDDLKLLDDGEEIPKSQGRGWQFDSRL